MNRIYNSETGRYDPDPFVDAPLGVQIVKHRDSGDEHWVVDADGLSFSDVNSDVFAAETRKPWEFRWFEEAHGDQETEVGWHLNTRGNPEIVGDTTPTEAILASWELELIAQGGTGYEALPVDFVTNSSQYSEEYNASEAYSEKHDEPIDLVPAEDDDWDDTPVWPTCDAVIRVNATGDKYFYDAKRDQYLQVGAGNPRQPRILPGALFRCETTSAWDNARKANGFWSPLLEVVL